MMSHLLSHLNPLNYIEPDPPIAVVDFYPRGLVPRAVLDARAPRKAPHSKSSDEENAYSAASRLSSHRGDWLRSPPGEARRLELPEYSSKKSRRRDSKKRTRYDPMRGNRREQPGYTPVLNNTSALTSENIQGWAVEVSVAAGAGA